MDHPRYIQLVQLKMKLIEVTETYISDPFGYNYLLKEIKELEKRIKETENKIKKDLEK